MSRMWRSLPLVFSAGLALSALPANGQIIADLRTDYDNPVTAHTNGQTSSGKIDDTLGSGSWNFYRSDLVDPTAGGANFTLLTYTLGSNGVRAGNSYVAPGASYDLPGWTSGQLITGPGEVGPAANELAVHPGQSTYAVAAWTSGYTGTVTLATSLRDTGTTGNGVTLDIRLNGSSLFSSGATSGSTPVTFNQSFAINSSDMLYFLVGNNGDFTVDSSALSATITAVPIPESASSVVLAGLTALAAALTHRRKFRAGA